MVLCAEKTGRKWGVLKGALFFIAVLLLIGAGCSSTRKERIKIRPRPSETPSPSPSEKADAKKLPPIQFLGTTIQSRDGLQKNWELSAKEVKYSEGSKTATASAVECVFYNPSGKRVLTVTARGASVDIESKSLRFSGAVSIRSGDGEQMEIKKLRWDGENKKLIGEGSVKIIRKDAVMSAARMEADPEMKRISLSGNVSVTYPDGENSLKF